jgi:hypothetical protein
MSIDNRLADADILWTYGRREGAFLSLLLAVEPIARREHPDVKGGGAAYQAFIDSRLPESSRLRFRQKPVTVGELMWYWMRCELAHKGTLPTDLQFFEPDDDSDEMLIQLEGPRDGCLRLSDSWYWWLRREIETA